MWYAECLKNCYNAVDRTFYDAIIFGNLIRARGFYAPGQPVFHTLYDNPNRDGWQPLSAGQGQLDNELGTPGFVVFHLDIAVMV